LPSENNDDPLVSTYFQGFPEQVAHIPISPIEKQFCETFEKEIYTPTFIVINIPFE